VTYGGISYLVCSSNNDNQPHFIADHLQNVGQM
jgi:hypothetical protein